MHRNTSNGFLALVAAAAFIAGVAAGYSRSVYKRRLGKHVSHPSSSAVDSVKQDDHDTWLPRQFDEELIQEFLARNYAFFGAESMTAIRNATVVVVGCGGVGSWAALMLLRRYLPFSFFFFFLVFSHPVRSIWAFH